MAGASVGNAHSAAGDALARAHAALLRQSDLQFDFAVRVPPPVPGWLKALADFLAAAGPVFKWVFWIGLALGVGAVLLFLGRELLAVRFPNLRRRPKPVAEPEWRPAAARARTLLEDADRLAAAGRFGEAAHLILFRSIEDIDARWPGQIRPALTSRDIADLDILPQAARSTFAGIARVVEQSFFGGRDVDAGAFAACRHAYQAFALPERT
ncbi:MAG: hypothetical protein P4L73_17395 [Caulobacteraceae bacterium]|nr:hypothetical protein [Caulobacteraceae bacterium]